MTEERKVESPVRNESTERMGAFINFLREKFGKAEVKQEVVQTAIQPREKPDLNTLPSLEELIDQLSNVTTWTPQEHGGRYNYFSRVDAVGEHAEKQGDAITITLPPEAESGNGWSRMVLHRGTIDADGELVYTTPYLMLDYFPGNKGQENEAVRPARVEVLHFPNRTRDGKELASVIRTYEENKK